MNSIWAILKIIIQIHWLISDDLVLIMRMTKPKLMFCDADNILTVQEALKQLDLIVPIFTFDREVEGAQFVEELFIDAGADINHFV